MPLETTEIDLAEFSTATGIGKPDLALSNPWERHQPISAGVENEFNNTNIPVLEPLKKNLNIQTTGGEVSLDDGLARDFAYLSRTRKLEVGTAKTAELQKIVDKFSAITNIQARVVVMNKGAEYEAFVCPDGTIFISQSLINLLDNTDQIAAVLAHEMGHLKNKTQDKLVIAADKWGGFEGAFRQNGIKWIHEMASDKEAVTLQEQAGYNSLAFAYAIDKVASNSRGEEHQSGLARASESIGMHMTIHSRTSNQPLQQKAEILTDEVRKSNLEVAREFIENPAKAKTVEFSVILEKLHPQDLHTAYQELVSNILQEKHETKNERKMVVLFNNLLSSRLQATGYDQDTINFYLLLKGQQANYYLLGGNPETIISLAKKYKDMDYQSGSDKAKDMSDLLFDADHRDYLFAEKILELIRSDMYDVHFPERSDGIPVTQNSLLDALEIISHDVQSYEARLSDNPQISRILTTYLGNTYIALAGENGADLDEEQINVFWQEVKDRGIIVDPKDILSDYSMLRFNLKDKLKQQLPLEWDERNSILVYDSFCKVFEVKLSESDIVDTAYIDNFFQKIAQEAQAGGFSSNYEERLEKFATQARYSFLEQNLTEAQRLAMAEYIGQKIAALNLPTEMSITHCLAGSQNTVKMADLASPDFALNDALRKFNLQLYFGIRIFPKDTPEFYTYVEKIMNESKIDVNQFSQVQLYNLLQGFFSDEMLVFINHYPHTTPSYLNRVVVEDFNRLANLPFMKVLLDKGETLNCQSLKELNKAILEMEKSVYWNGNKGQIFDDNRFSLFMSQAFRENFTRILQDGLTDNDLGDLYTTIDKIYPTGDEKQLLLTAINRKYLSSPNVPLSQKTDYLLENFDRIGLEGMVIVAETINDIKTYQAFREQIGQEKIDEYLSGSGAVAAAAGLDIASSFFAGYYRDLFETGKNDPKSKLKLSTSLAIYWFIHYFHLNQGQLEKYAQRGNFELSSGDRAGFRSFADIVGSLTNLSALHRFIICHKELTEADGAFSTPQSRKKLANIVVSSLNLGDGFIASVLRTACQEGDAKVIAFPAAQMISKLLFRAYDLDSVDATKMSNVSLSHSLEEHVNTPLDKVLTTEQIQEMLHKGTRDLYAFGAAYAKQPDSFFYQLAQGSDKQYRQTQDLLNSFLRVGPLEESNGSGVDKKNVDASIEAVIKGVEASGALGVRALQLASQFHRFPLEMAARLDQCFDNTSVLNTKLAVWENLYKFGQNNPAIQAVLEKTTIYNRMGGGSLQSTWAAEYEDQQTVVKIMAPNAEAFVNQRYELASKVLQSVLKNSRNRQVKDAARKGLTLVRLSRDWCLKDIQDPTYTTDDDVFKGTVEQFSQSTESANFYTTERMFTSPLFKMERRGQGPTLNKLLADPNVSLEQKRAVLTELRHFFDFQMEKVYQDEKGQEFYMFHADPHVGNYLVDLAQGTNIGVIDRHMYLKLVPADVAVLKKLMVGGNDNDFVYSFVERVLDTNRITGAVERRTLEARVIGTVVKEYLTQRIRGKVDRFALLGTMLNEFSNIMRKADAEELADRNVDVVGGMVSLKVPLGLRLMVRNIGALKELQSRYNLPA